MNRLLRSLFTALCLLLCGLTIAPIPTQAAPATGAALFEAQCVGCHIGGGNIIRRGKTLQLKALQKNGYDTAEAIATIVSQGKNNMSAYSDRLSPEEIAAVSAYVLEQAKAGWPRS